MTLTWKEAAYKVLKESKNSMHIDTLAERAIELKTEFNGKTPERTIVADIGKEIRSKGDKSRFILLGEGYYGLTEWNEEIEGIESETAYEETEVLDESLPGFHEAIEHQKSMDVLDKRQKEEFDFDSFEEYSDMMLDAQKKISSKQRRVTVRPPDNKKWLGVAIFGDLHFGDPYQDTRMLRHHTEKVLATENVIAIQVGDLLHEQAAITHRVLRREAPFEHPLAMARKACREWFKTIGPKMAAFIIGNHDERPLISEGMDIGEFVAEYIAGAYLGPKGDLIIPFNDDLIYAIRIVHGQKEGYSMWNPLHPGARVSGKRPYIDFVAFGHRHASSAYNNIPLYDDVRVISIRSAGYNRNEQELEAEGIPACHYAWKVGEGEAKPGTPIVLFHPERKEYVMFTDLDLGLVTLKLYNKFNVR